MSDHTNLVQLVIEKTKAGRLSWRVVEKGASRTHNVAAAIFRVPESHTASLSLPDGTDVMLRFRFPTPGLFGAPTEAWLELIGPDREDAVEMTLEQAKDLAEAVTGQRDEFRGRAAEALKSL